jgi:hypothetical protein
MADAHPIPSNPRFKDLTGKTFGLWSVVSYAGKRKNNLLWNCRCMCGVEKVVQGTNITSGKSAGCGCVQYAKLTERNTKHGLSDHPLYGVWSSVKQRCNPAFKDKFEGWAGRGIKICDRWANSFEHFLVDMGERPSADHQIERKDNDGDYEPGNCIWATRTEQMRNMRRNRIVTFNGREMTLTEAIKECGIPGGTVHGRLRIGWDVDRALTTPHRQRRNSKT